MRILHLIARLNLGGTSRWLSTLVPAQLARGHEVWIATGRVGRHEVEDTDCASLPLIRINSWTSEGWPGQTRAWPALAHTLRQFRPDLINTHTTMAGLLGRSAAVASSIPAAVVHTYHGHHLHGYGSPARVRTLVYAERALARHSDALIAVGQSVRQDLLGVGIGRQIPFVSIPPACVAPRPIDSGQARAQLGGLGANEVVVGWSGRFVRVKNPMRALAAAHLTPEVTWVLAGEGPMLPDARRRAPANVLLPGVLDRDVLIAASDLFVSTSDNEGMPYSVVEAVLAGRPAVVTEVGSMPELVVNGTTGFVVAPNPPALAGAVERLAGSAALRQRMGTAARSNAAERFSPSRFVEQHEAAYSMALEHRGQAGRR